jgi:Tfp pilus assembly protein PilF
VPQPVSLVDLRPTLLETVGLRDPSPISGRSLRAALSGREIASGNCYSASDFPLLEYGWSPLRSLTTADWKYIRSPEAELYDLSSDPQETNNLAAAMPDQVHKLENQLAALEQTMVTRQATAVKLSSSERRALESLGYLGGQSRTRQPDAPGEQLPDVKRMLPIFNKVEAANKLQTEGDAPAAELRLRELVREAPEYLRAQFFLAEALTKQQKFAESRGVLEGVLEHHPDNSEAHFQLGSIYWEQEQFAEAADEFRKSLATKPHAYGSLFCLAQSLVKLGQVEDAEEAFRRVLEQDPLYTKAHVALANVLADREGRIAEAEEHFRQALRYTPSLVEAHDKLAILLARQNRLEEAAAHFTRAVELSPNRAALRFNFGTVLMQQGRRGEAIREFEEALRLDPQYPDANTQLQRARNMRGK